MSELKPNVRTAWEFPPQSRVVLAAEYEALAQRCRELMAELEKAHKATNAECMDWAREYERRKQVQEERDALAQQCAELEVLLKGTSESYALRCDELQKMRAEVERLQAKLRRIEYVAECGSVQSWLALPDDAKAQWFAMHLEMDDERRALRQDAARYRFLREQHNALPGCGEYSVMKFCQRANEWLHTDFKLDAEIDRAMEASQ